MRIKLNKATKIIETWLNLLAKGTYEPIIKVWTGPKGTRRHLLHGLKANRCHHLLSDGEYREAIYRESLPQTLDFFEQFPLWNIERCIRIANDMGIKYPVDRDNEAYVLSTDFLCRNIALCSGKIDRKARSYKPLDSLLLETKHPISVTRTLQKLELEHRYWAEENVGLEVITDVHISKQCAANLKWARSAAYNKEEFIAHEEPFLYYFLNTWQAAPLSSLQENLQVTADKLRISYSDAFSLFQWCLWTHQLPVDLEQRINPLNAIHFKMED